VVGVARNSKHQFVNEAPEPLIYLPYFQNGDNETIIQVSTRGDPHVLEPLVVHAVREINAKVPLTDVRALYETTQVALAFVRIQALFGTVIALLALALASTGIYGLVAYRTQMRRQEIGIRIALGASRADVLRLVLGQGLRMTAAGLMVGLVISALLTRFLRGLLYGVSATDPVTIICVTLLLLVIAVVACLLPALKAVRVDPMAAIREQ
jgi:ABC-type antimicrobial peptide transport system permease subunit